MADGRDGPADDGSNGRDPDGPDDTVPPDGPDDTVPPDGPDDTVPPDGPDDTVPPDGPDDSQAGAEATGGEPRHRASAGEHESTDADSALSSVRIGPVSLQVALTAGLALVVVLAALGVVYVATTPSASTDPSTDLYVLGPDGAATDYPENLTRGGTGTVTVGIDNHEQQRMTYRVEVVYNDETIETLQPTVPDGETWRDRVSFQAGAAGEQRLRVQLYRADGAGERAEPYRETSLLVRVGAGTRATEPPQRSIGSL